MIRTIYLRLCSLGQHRALKREIDDELSFHVERRTAENIAAGLPPEEAARAARRRFGNVQSIREACRETRRASFGESIWQDIHFGTRILLKNPAFTTVAVLTLALGIGANTAIFSVINGVLLRPLPYRDPDKLVTVAQTSVKRGFSQVVVTPAMFRDWREQNDVFEELGGQIYDSANLTGIEKPEHLHAAWATPNYFSVFGVPPFLGRTFIAEDKPPGHRVAVLSYGLWQRSFGGDHDVVGQKITLNGLVYTVVGVMPPYFKIYQPAAVFGLPTGDVQPQLWMPYPSSMDERTNHYFLAFGRLKPGVTPAKAESELNVISERFNQQRVADGLPKGDWGASVRRLDEQVVSGSRPALRLLLGAVGFVLLISCANVANLLLARSAARGKEFAVRSALGAGRLRLVRQLLVESTILAVLGGGLGVLLARGGLLALTVLQPASLPRLDEVRLDSSVLAFTLLVSVFTGLLFGLAPALQSSKPNLNESLKEGGRSASQGRQGRRVRSVLVVAEVAISMILLAGAGLMLQSFARLTRINPGFAPEQIVSFDFSLGGHDYDRDPVRIGLIRQLRERVQARPGLSSVATVYGLPFGTMLNATAASRIEGGSDSGSQRNTLSAWRVVSPGYFATMGVSLARGRGFSEGLDTPNSMPVAIINEAFARNYFPDSDPLGRRIQIFTLSTNWNEIVGVIKDVKLTSLDAPETPEIYQCDTQNGEWMFSLVVRSRLPMREVEKLVRAEATAVNRDLPPFNVRTMEQAIGTTVAPRRFTMILIGLFALLALALTAVGIYGVLSYSVAQQTREIGIRMALGASRRSVLGLVLRDGTRIVLAGIGIGLAGSLGLTRLIASQLFGVGPNDPATFLVVALLLTGVALAACCLPARRAAKMDPMEALRCE